MVLGSFCDGNMPSFNPIDYNPEELKYEQPPPKPPVVRPPETPAPPEVPKNAAPEVKSTGSTSLSWTKCFAYW